MNDADMENQSEETNFQKPSWLKALEEQSWQAELLISGLVVAGLFQLPGLYIKWIEGFMYDSSELGYTFLSFASMLTLAGIFSLMIFFGVHFFLRAIWVSLLGLNSVYPKGINADSTNGAGPEHWKKMKAKYPNLTAYNIELDNACSSMFSSAIVIVIMFSSLSILILLFYRVFKYLITVFPILSNYVIFIGVGLYLLFVVVATVLQILAKRYPENKNIQLRYSAFNNAVSGLFTLYVFSKPVGYITNIAASNVDPKSGGRKWLWIFIVCCGFLGFYAAIAVDGNPVFEYFDEDYISFNNNENRQIPYNYEDQIPEDTRYFTATIPSYQIRTAALPLFVPRVKREQSSIDLIKLGIIEKIKMSSIERDSIRNLNLEKRVVFQRIYLDGKEVNVRPKYYENPNENEDGLLYIIPTASLFIGEHLIEIKKEFYAEDGRQKIIRIPFYFEGKSAG